MAEEFGFTAVVRSQKKLLEGYSKSSPYVDINEFQIPDTAVVKAVEEYVKSELSPETYRHSVRAFYYGQAIVKVHFPDWKFTPEVYYLSCLLHDIATTPKNLRATKLSFEYYGGFLAYDIITKNGGSQDLAESVTEAIIRHQDFIEDGMLTQVGQVLQLSTILDNMGAFAQLVDEKTIEEISNKFPRNKWTGCFADVVKDEVKLKPWAHTTAMGPSTEDIVNGILGNKTTAKYD